MLNAGYAMQIAIVLSLAALAGGCRLPIPRPQRSVAEPPAEVVARSTPAAELRAGDLPDVCVLHHREPAHGSIGSDADLSAPVDDTPGDLPVVVEAIDFEGADRVGDGLQGRSRIDDVDRALVVHGEL